MNGFVRNFVNAVVANIFINSVIFAHASIHNFSGVLVTTNFSADAILFGALLVFSSDSSLIGDNSIDLLANRAIDSVEILVRINGSVVRQSAWIFGNRRVQ